jgi:hypothetical protein
MRNMEIKSLWAERVAKRDFSLHLNECCNLVSEDTTAAERTTLPRQVSMAGKVLGHTDCERKEEKNYQRAVGIELNCGDLICSIRRGKSIR